MRIVIPGGSGQIGRLLAQHFHAQGHDVTVFSRTPTEEPWRVLWWDAHAIGPWAQALEASDVCINLAGRSVNCRYGAVNRALIHDSRIRATRVLRQAIAQLAHPPRLWLNASTATIYRHALDRPMDEFTGELGGNEPGAPDTWNFSIAVARDWEQEFFSFPTPHTLRIALRTSIVFNVDPGSAFAILSRLARFGLGGAQGSGRQYVSWLHERDFVRAIDFLIANESLEGIVNIASPNPLPNCDFMRALREAWHQPIGLPAPEWLIEASAIFLRTESELVLKSRRVIPTRLLNAGFIFQFPEWPTAAQDLVRLWKERHS